ncbi:universal stress protein [Nonomuraea sp. NPDC048916]|uniref:universal stress protein n=1 Tax=Nonomuraea sp. NPDC048916 TaxID=3154232 RepID=UPI0033DAAE3D
MKVHRIVVGTDGTPQSEAALLWAADEAVRRQAELVIVHAWGTPAEHHAPYARYAWHRDLSCQRSIASAALDRAVASVRDAHAGLSVRPELVRGRPERVLAGSADGAELLVLGSAAHQAGDGHLGPVLLSCLRWPPCPVVVVSSALAVAPWLPETALVGSG